jgi:hypothetical protein
MAYSYKYNPISSVLDLVDSDGFTYGVWGYVTNYSALPLGITTIDPQIGDLVGVDTSQGIWPINYRASGFYRRIAMTGLATTDYGNSPFAGYPNTATQVEVDAGLLNDKYVSPITYQNGSKWLTKEDVSNKSISVVADQTSNIKYPSVKSIYDWVTANYQPKKFSYTDTVLGTATSGAGNQFSKSVLIPANTLTSGALNIKGRATKSGSSSYGWLNVYVNSANNLSGAAHLGQINSAGGNTLVNFAIDRTIPIQAGSFVTFIVNTTNGFEEIVTNNASTTTIDWTVDQYVILSCQSNGGADILRANFLSVNQF